MLVNTDVLNSKLEPMDSGTLYNAAAYNCHAEQSEPFLLNRSHERRARRFLRSLTNWVRGKQQEGRQCSPSWKVHRSSD